MTLPDRVARLASSDVVAAAFILAVLLNLSFFPYLWGGKTLLSSASDTSSVYGSGASATPFGVGRGTGAFKVLDPGAPGWQTEPDFAQIKRQLFVEKRWPLWNPAVGYGEPLAANMQSQPYFPLSVIMVVHPSPAAYNWWCVARLFIAGLGAFSFLRLFIGFWPALAGGISMMYAGYYLIYYDMPHLSVETLIPWLFYVNERLVRTPRFPQILASAGVNVLVYLGGMPESQLLALAFAYTYALYRVFTDTALRANAFRVGGALAVEALAGVGGSAFLLLPFLEYTRLCFDVHQVENNSGNIFGIRHEQNPILALTYAVPLIFGPPLENVATNLSGFTGVRGFFGISEVYLAFVAVLGAASDRLRRLYRWSGIVPFFALAVCLLIMKRFGVVVVNWIGLLPGFSLIDFPKYEEPLLAFSVAALTGFGVARIAAERSSAVIRWWASVLALCLLTVTFLIVRSMITPSMAGRGYTICSLLFAIAVLGIVVLVSAVCGALTFPLTRTFAVIGIVAVVALEVTGDYLLPIHYFINEPPPATLDPYRGAPFVAFLQRATSLTHDRTVGQDSLLYPDWAGAFGLSDVRDLDAMYDRHYLPFVRSFIDSNGSDAELAGRFTSAPQLETRNQLRLLALSSVRFVATNHVLDPSKTFFRQAYFQNIGTVPAEKKTSLSPRLYTIGGVERDGLLEHPPFDRLPLHVMIPKGVRRFSYGVGMDPAVYAPGAAMCGVGATFTLEVRDAAGHITPLSRRSIDPKHDVTQRHWIDQSVDVYRWAGAPVDFLLSTAPWPRNDTCADWAVWGGGTFTPIAATRGTESPFTLAYRDRNVFVYEFAKAMPRISIYQNVQTSITTDVALTALTDPTFDISRRVIVTPQGPEDTAEIGRIDGVPLPARAGRLLEYNSQYVRARVSVKRRSLVVLDDTDFPGWNAYVDGTRAPVLRANALFRGVAVDPGEHNIEFKYEPNSFRIGACITLITIAAGVAAGFLFRSRRRDVTLRNG